MKNNLDFYSGKKILITGNTGFKGSWLSIYLRCLGSSVYGLSDMEYDGLYKMANVNKILSDQLFVDINNISLDELESLILSNLFKLDLKSSAFVFAHIFKFKSKLAGSKIP